MSFLLGSLAQLPTEDKKALIAGGIGVLNAAPIAILAGVGALALSWNLEHIAWDGNENKFRRLSTQETSDLTNKNITPLMPPIQSLAVRLADAGADTAEGAMQLAQETIKTHQSKGLLGDIAAFLFGSG